MFLERKLHMLMIKKKRREDGKNVDMTKSRVKKKRRRIQGGDSREQEERQRIKGNTRALLFCKPSGFAASQLK